MTFPIPGQDDGDLIDEDIWNDLVAGVNENHGDYLLAAADIATLNDRTTDPETGNEPLGSRVATLEAGSYDPTKVTSYAGMEAALLEGGEIYVDGNVEIEITSPLEVNVPATKIFGGLFRVPGGVGFRITANDVEMDGCTIVGNGTDTYDITQRLVLAQGTSGTRLNAINLRNLKMWGSRGYNIRLEWCVDSNVTNCIMRRYLYSGVTVISGRRIKVADCTISDARLVSGVSNVYGIAFTDDDNTEAARSVDCSAVGNTVHEVDWEGIDTHGGKGIVITGNTITACPRSVALVGGNGTRIMMPEECVVSGNYMNGEGQRQTIREGLFIGGIAGTPADCTATGNIILNHSPNIYTNYIDRDKTYIGGNNVPLMDWTDIPLAEFTSNPVYTPQYKIDGNTVYFRGGAIPSSGTADVIGNLPNASAWPSTLSFLGYVKESGGGSGNGMLAVDETGELKLWYRSGTTTFTYFLSGSYEAR